MVIVPFWVVAAQSSLLRQSPSGPFLLVRGSAGPLALIGTHQPGAARVENWTATRKNFITLLQAVSSCEAKRKSRQVMVLGTKSIA